jgi:hypothetical protein
MSRRGALSRHRAWFAGVALLCLGAPGTIVGLTASPAAASGAGVRPAAWVRSAASVPAVPRGSRALGELAGSTSMRADVVLEPRDPAALEAFDTAVSTPGSPTFRRYLAPGAFAGRFGPDPSTISAVRQWLVARGLAVGPTSRDGLIVPVSGRAEGMGSAFGVGFERYRLPSGRVAHVPTAGPMVPASLARAVGGVVGLDDLTVPVPELARAATATATAATATAAATASTPASAPAQRIAGPVPHAGGPVPTAGCQSSISTGRASAGAYTADQLAQAYSFAGLYPSDEGAGVTVGVYELEPYRPADVATFENCYSPAITATVTAVPVDQSVGAVINNGPGQGEAALDIEMVVGMAPQVSVDVYDGPNGGSGPLDTYGRMVDDDAVRVISTSWGQCEAQTAPAVRQAESEMFQQAEAQGQTVTAAAGDEGSEDCFFFPSSSDTRLQVDDPGSQPWVTSVGATSLRTLGPAPGEAAWNSGLFAGTGGGGSSTEWTMPSWQLGPGVENAYTQVRDSFTGASPCPVGSGPATSSCREVPDVSSDGDPATGMAVYCSCFGGWAKIGGTSMSSPLWGALAALADQGQSSPVGFMDPVLYQAACRPGAPFNDVTVGENQPNGGPSDPPRAPGGPYYPAAAGYDLATGLGSPIATGVVATLRAPPPNSCPRATGLSASSGPAIGGTVLTVSGANLSSVVEVDVGPGNPAAIVSETFTSVTVRTPPSPTGGWSTEPVLLKFPGDIVGVDGTLPFTYVGPAGYWTVASDGGIFAFGNVGFYGSTGGIRLDQPIVGMAATPSSQGYWLVASDGGIFAYGDAGFYGSTGGIRLTRPVVGMASTPDGRGYWLVASDGGIFAYGDAGFYGSTGGIRLVQPIVGMATTHDGGGYWLVASDGGIFAFGDATFYGSTGGIRLTQPVVGMATTPDGGGYWLVASDGGIFAYGDAAFHGSTGGIALARPVVGMAATPDGNGYWLVASDGGIFAFGGSYGGFYGSEGGTPLARPMVGIGAPQGGAIG